MWKAIEKDEYMQKVAGLKPLESFSDADGVLSFGYGVPAMDTIWGNDSGPLLKCEMRKADRHQADWDYFYFIITREAQLESALQQLLESIPSQSEDVDWWTDDLHVAFKKAYHLLNNTNPIHHKISNLLKQKQ